MKEFFTTPVIWFLIGLGLLLLELVLPGLIVIFFGAGAWIVALAVLFFPEIGLALQLGIFAVFSILGLLIFRKILKNRFFKEGDSQEGSLEEEFIGKTAIAETDIDKGQTGKVSFKGTNWSAISDCDIKKGATVVITQKDSITLKVTLSN